MNLSTVLGTTKSNIAKNKWMAFSTIVVIGIVFSISTFFILTTLVIRGGISYYEKRAQIAVYFKTGTPETEIFAVKDKVNDPNKIESITYISESEAVKLYLEYLKDYDPTLVETVTTGSLPASLEVRAKNIDNLFEVLNTINTEKESNPFIDEVVYYQDVVDKLRTISNAISYGGLALVVALSVITFALIMITIGFNIMSHRDEIEVMHLVGSTDSFIRAPFILEGSYYGMLGGLLAAFFIGIPWIIIVSVSKDSSFYLLMSQTLSAFGFDFLVNPSVLPIILFLVIEVVIGIVLGAIASSFAVFKYLNLKEK